ncbi:hypothetical protein GF314_01255 [bacterium]|nr:hypothetical protein [bacterium]
MQAASRSVVTQYWVEPVPKSRAASCWTAWPTTCIMRAAIGSPVSGSSPPVATAGTASRVSNASRASGRLAVTDRRWGTVGLGIMSTPWGWWAKLRRGDYRRIRRPGEPRAWRALTLPRAGTILPQSRPTPKGISMTRALAHVIGTFFGSGYGPIAPASWGSLAYALLWWGLWTWLGPIPVWVQLVALVVVFVVGVWAARELERAHGQDPSLCVIDEVAGMQVTYLGLAAGPMGWLAGLFWFRVFDILKPFGIRRLEKLGGGGGVGIMADDVGAGVAAAVTTQITVRVLGWM